MEINEFDCFSMQSPQSFAFGKIQLPLLRGAFQIVKFQFVELFAFPIYHKRQAALRSLPFHILSNYRETLILSPDTASHLHSHRHKDTSEQCTPHRQKTHDVRKDLLK